MLTVKIIVITEFRTKNNLEHMNFSETLNFFPLPYLKSGWFLLLLLLLLLLSL